MNWTCLITSAGFLDPELAAQFGRIPPTFLPIGNRRLFVHQYETLSAQPDRIVLSIPEDFEPDGADLQLLSDLNFVIVRVPVGLSLGESVVHVINSIAFSSGRFSILHGDTLLNEIDFSILDGVSVDVAPSVYKWGLLSQATNSTADNIEFAAKEPNELGQQLESADATLSGWFSFSNAPLLVQAITHERGDFIRALKRYSGERPLRAISTSRWLDFGHAITFDQSRRRFTTERHFNKIISTHRTIIKTGTNNRKIEAEADWFEMLPAAMRIHTPAYLGLSKSEHSAQYELEYLHLPTLTDLFVFGRQPRKQWHQIFNCCNEFLSTCMRHPAPRGRATETNALYEEKTMERLAEFARAKGTNVKSPCRFSGIWLPSLEQIVNIAAAAIPVASERHLSLVHGDFCFSNIFYDIRANIVRVIDPRGMDARGTVSQYGDLRYDIGKLYHSVIGRYDEIIAGYYILQKYGELNFSLELRDGALVREIESEFLEHSFAGTSSDDTEILAISVLLFISMLPLHADDVARQHAFLANALRLFVKLDERLRSKESRVA